MSDKIGWIDNLRAVACLMVVLIHSTTYYVTAAGMPGERHWDVVNLLNFACRVGVPLFFMISGYLFFGKRRAGKNTCCVLASACCFTARWPWRIWHC